MVEDPTDKPGQLPEDVDNHYFGEVTPYENPSVSGHIDFFYRTFTPKTDVVYYPGSSADLSIARTPSFRNSRVIHVDTLRNAIRALQQSGLEAHQADAETFDPGKVDIVVLLNFNAEKPPSFVLPGGYVICNNQWGTATSMRDREEFELKGVVTVDEESGEPSLDTANLEDYWREVETDEAFKESTGDYIFGRAQEDVVRFFGTDTEILEHYKQLHRQSKEQFGLDGVAPDGSLLYPIPKKKAGGYFIYQRKLPETAY